MEYTETLSYPSQNHSKISVFTPYIPSPYTLSSQRFTLKFFPNIALLTLLLPKLMTEQWSILRILRYWIVNLFSPHIWEYLSKEKHDCTATLPYRSLICINSCIMYWWLYLFSCCRWTSVVELSLWVILWVCLAAGCWWPFCMRSRGQGAERVLLHCVSEEEWALRCVLREFKTPSNMRTYRPATVPENWIRS